MVRERWECGGERVIVPGECVGGWYLTPAVVTDCQDDMRFVQEEIFGSVAACLVFDTEEEVLTRANKTTFGLAAGVDDAARTSFTIRSLFSFWFTGKGPTY